MNFNTALVDLACVAHFVVLSGVKVAAHICGHVAPNGIASCCLLLLVVACCCLLLIVVSCCCLLLLAVACCCLLLVVC